MIENIYYRGYLKSCNYRCGYCPFSKNKESQMQIKKDKEALARFINYIENLQNEVSIMITPYGEAMYYQYYEEAVAYLTTINNVVNVGIQTNLSFDINKFIEIINSVNGEKGKIRLWCSYHPTMVTQEKFIKQCEKLRENNILYSVGCVGVPEEINNLTSLRKKLPIDTYMWVNRQDGLRRAYTNEEKYRLLKIDPLFISQINYNKKNLSECTAGIKSIFIEASGDYYPCHISHKKMGSIYIDGNTTRECLAKRCDCYLAYVNTQDCEDILGNAKYEKYTRTILKDKIDAVFIDLDGTLLDDKGNISSENQRAIKHISQTMDIYISTARPYKDALLKYRKVKEFIAGGIFANGGYIVCNKIDYKEIISLDVEEYNSLKEVIDFNKQHLNVKVYEENHEIYKIVLMGNKQKLNDIYNSISDKTNCVIERNTLSITKKHINKGYGVSVIIEKLKYNKTLAIGNSENDISMFDKVTQSISVLDGDSECRQKADRVMEVCHIPIFYN